MIDYFILLVFLAYVVVGLLKPAVACAGYVWVSLFDPVGRSYSFLSGTRLSLIMAVVCIVSAAIHFNRLRRPRYPVLAVSVLSLAGWVTATSYRAWFPAEAWLKWDWAFKTMLFSVLCQFVFHTRRQFELLVFTFVGALSFYTISAGAKGALGGGGYGVSFVYGSGGSNTGLSESSTLAGMAVVVVPLVLFLRSNATLIARAPAVSTGLAVLLVPLSFSAAVASYARTGLVAMGVLLLSHFFRVRRKILYAAALGAGVLIALSFASSSWTERMGTVRTYDSETSAASRTAVWRWTVDFAAAHFMGGGFGAYRANEGELGPYLGDELARADTGGARAFHSIYFEVLGEHGFVGLSLFIAMILFTLLVLLRQIRGRTTGETEKWRKEAASALLEASVVFLAAGLFIGVAFAPYLYFLIAMAAALGNVREEVPMEGSGL